MSWRRKGWNLAMLLRAFQHWHPRYYTDSSLQLGRKRLLNFVYFMHFNQLFYSHPTSRLILPTSPFVLFPITRSFFDCKIPPEGTYKLTRGPEEVPNKCLLNEWVPVGLGSTALTHKHLQGPLRALVKLARYSPHFPPPITTSKLVPEQLFAAVVFTAGGLTWLVLMIWDRDVQSESGLSWYWTWGAPGTDVKQNQLIFEEQKREREPSGSYAVRRKSSPLLPFTVYLVARATASVTNVTAKIG